MNKEEWKVRITDACKQAGTYQPYFDAVIDTLAKVLEDRDKADMQFEATGGNPIISHTNKAHETNLVKNPVLVMRNELNTQALAYWRDLGLTPKGLKALSNDVMEKGNSGGLEELLKKLDG